jgi:hypothetical protein
MAMLVGFLVVPCSKYASLLPEKGGGVRGILIRLTCIGVHVCACMHSCTVSGSLICMKFVQKAEDSLPYFRP